MYRSFLVFWLTSSLTSALLYKVSASDALKDLFSELNYPQQLAVWNSSGGDPYEESWKGISCNGSSVIFIQSNGLELNGRLGDQLFNLIHLNQLNVSSNHKYATYIDLAFNDFSGNIPYSLTTSMKYLHHLNLSHNSLSGPIGNVFTSLQNLKRIQSNGLELNGRLGDQLFNLIHLNQLNASPNHIYGEIPASLPPNLYINLPKSSYSKDFQTSFEEQEEEEQQQPPQPDQEEQQQPPQPDQEEQQQPPQPDQEDQQQPPQPNQEEHQHNGNEVADGGDDGEEAGGGNGEEAGGGNDEDEVDEDEEDEDEENEDEEDEEEEDRTNETDSFCRPDDLKTYRDNRLLEKMKRTKKHFLRKGS